MLVQLLHINSLNILLKTLNLKVKKYKTRHNFYRKKYMVYCLEAAGIKLILSLKIMKNFIANFNKMFYNNSYLYFLRLIINFDLINKVN